jgi:hypothetical protein
MSKAMKASDYGEVWVFCRGDLPVEADPGITNPIVAATFYCESYPESP